MRGSSVKRAAIVSPHQRFVALLAGIERARRTRLNAGMASTAYVGGGGVVSRWQMPCARRWYSAHHVRSYSELRRAKIQMMSGISSSALNSSSLPTERSAEARLPRNIIRALCYRAEMRQYAQLKRR